jgi:hypothetical protein
MDLILNHQGGRSAVAVAQDPERLQAGIENGPMLPLRGLVSVVAERFLLVASPGLDPRGSQSFDR